MSCSASRLSLAAWIASAAAGSLQHRALHRLRAVLQRELHCLLGERIPPVLMQVWKQNKKTGTDNLVSAQGECSLREGAPELIYPG